MLFSTSSTWNIELSMFDKWSVCRIIRFPSNCPIKLIFAFLLWKYSRHVSKRKSPPRHRSIQISQFPIWIVLVILVAKVSLMYLYRNLRLLFQNVVPPCYYFIWISSFPLSNYTDYDNIFFLFWFERRKVCKMMEKSVARSNLNVNCIEMESIWVCVEDFCVFGD